MFLAAAFTMATAQKSRTATERKVAFQSFAEANYFERNDSNLKGNSSYLVFANAETFERIFSPAATSGDNLFMPDNVFDSKLVIAMIKRGESIYKYDLKKVTAKNKKLYVWYDAAPKNPAAVEKTRDDGSYSYATSCFLTVDKSSYTDVIFMENGKKAGSVSINQSKKTEKRA